MMRSNFIEPATSPLLDRATYLRLRRMATKRSNIVLRLLPIVAAIMAHDDRIAELWQVLAR